MSEHKILNPADHGELRIRTDASEELGDGAMVCIAVPPEFRRLACEYPILFRRDAESGNFSALCMMGFENGENLFLQDGRWDASVKPLAMEIRPFLIGRPASDGGEAQVHVDMASPRISANGEGVRVFDDSGQPTPYLEQIVDRLGALHQGYEASPAFHEALSRYDLLEPFSLDVTLKDGSQNRLVGYHMINEEKVAALEPGALAELHEAGHLAPIFMAMASLGNLAKLVERKNRTLDG